LQNAAAAVCDAARVLTETVNGTAAPFVTDTLAGTVHVAPNGAPEHEKDSVPVNPVPGEACKLN
jgi:hypothetical protein